MLSSFTKVSASPFLTVTLSEENTRPCWWITWLAASAPADRPEKMTRVNRTVFCMGYPRIGLGSAGEDRYGGRTEVAGQGFHEGDQIGFFLCRETKRLHQVGAARPVDTAAIVMFNHRFQRGERAIVHKGTSARNFAQARRLEGVLHLDYARHELATADILARQPDVLKTVIGEIPALMAGGAKRLAVEDGKAALGFLGDGFLVSFNPGVERRTLGDHGTFVGRDRLGERRGSHPFVGKCRGEQRLVFADGGKPFHQLLERHVHLARGLDRTERLLFEGREPAVPHEDRAPRGIDDGRRMPAELRHAVADADRQPVAPAEARAVTTCAGLR